MDSEALSIIVEMWLVLLYLRDDLAVLLLGPTYRSLKVIVEKVTWVLLPCMITGVLS
jgi:hypothetical protein